MNDNDERDYTEEAANRAELEHADDAALGVAIGVAGRLVEQPGSGPYANAPKCPEPECLAEPGFACVDSSGDAFLAPRVLGYMHSRRTLLADAGALYAAGPDGMLHRPHVPAPSYLAAARLAVLGEGPQPDPARISGWHFDDGQADAMDGHEPDPATTSGLPASWFESSSSGRGWWTAESEGANFRLRAGDCGLKIMCGACGAEEWITHNAAVFDMTLLMNAISAHRNSRHHGQQIH